MLLDWMLGAVALLQKAAHVLRTYASMHSPESTFSLSVYAPLFVCLLVYYVLPMSITE